MVQPIRLLRKLKLEDNTDQPTLSFKRILCTEVRQK